MEIPIVDFDEFLKNTNRLKVSKQVIDTVKKYGFVYLKNYGISKESVEKLFLYNKEFFDKPFEFKCSLKRSFSNSLCGYDGVSEEKSNIKRPADMKEAFIMTRNDSVWPQSWNDFKEFMQDFHQKCYLLSLEILRSFAIGLGLEQKEFESKFINADCAFLRLIHYPPLPEIIGENQIRAGEHTDYGALTILFQDLIGGLEVKTLENEWISAPYLHNTILINVGNVMEIWTNGSLKSTPHRVVNPNDERKFKSRYSNVFFFEPDFNVELKCMDCFQSGDNPAKFKSIIYKDYLFESLKATYDKFDL